LDTGKLFKQRTVFVGETNNKRGPWRWKGRLGTTDMNTGNSRLSWVMVGGKRHGKPKTTVKTKVVKTWYQMDLM
jgi:hypothetical protein